MTVLGGLVFALYASFLSYAPPGLHQHEIFFGLHAQAIAKSGRDLDGHWLPLYFLIRLNGLDLWFHPFLIYATQKGEKGLFYGVSCRFYSRAPG